MVGAAGGAASPGSRRDARRRPVSPPTPARIRFFLPAGTFCGPPAPGPRARGTVARRRRAR